MAIEKCLVLAAGVLAVNLGWSATTAELWPGNTWYVDDDNYGKSGDGTTPEKAFGTLQEANDSESVAAGDIIKVLPGTYNQGSQTHDQNSRKSRFVVTKKLRFEAEKGTASVVGELSTESCHYGADGMRCVFVATTAKGAEFHGLTFCNGSASAGTGGGGGGGDGEGGGVCVYGGQASGGGKNANGFAGAFFVDCVVSNCWGLWSGGARGGTWIRSLFIDCGGKSWGNSAGEAALWNCVIANSTALQGDRPTVGNRSRLVNCTFYQCGSYGTAADSTAFNCLYACRTGSEDMHTTDDFGKWYPAAVFTNCYGSADDPRMLFAPAFGDFRIRSGSKADQGGLTDYLLNEIILPADTEMKDYCGNPIDTTAVKCQAGACQATATAATGHIRIPAGHVFNGWTAKTTTYAFSETFPDTLVIRPLEAKHFRFRLGGFFGNSTFRYVQNDGTLHLAYPPDPNGYTSFSEDKIGLELWTDPTASADEADGTEDHPFRTIQAAMDYLAVTGKYNTVIHAKPGDYCEGGKMHGNASNRVVMADFPILLKSTGGAAVTRIIGKSDPNSPSPLFPGCGPAAMRCLAFDNPSGNNRAVQGFTFADGRSGYKDYSSVDNCEFGAGVLSLAKADNLQVLDCVVTNCWAVRCGAFMGTWNTRCAIYDCHAYGGVMRITVLSSCYVDSSCTTGEGPVGGSANKVLGTDTASCLTTCIGASYANKWHLSNLGLNALNNGFSLWGTVAPPDVWCASNPTHGATNCVIEAVDSANGDWRLVTGAKATTVALRPEVGTAEYGTWATNLAGYVSSGLDGSKLSVIDGHIVPGCFQKTVDGVRINAANGGLAISGGKLGFNEATTSLEISISAGSGTRPCLGVTVNGVTNLFSVTPVVKLTASEVSAAGGKITVEPVYGTEWYVNPNPEVGSDDNNGFTSETPKRSLAAVMNAGVTSGDTVHAAPGKYASEVMGLVGDLKCSNTFSRVVVPAGATLVSDAGAADTFIVGADSDAPNKDIHGRGTNAVRCVYLQTGACVRGFTLTGGRTWGDKWENSNYTEYKGGGAFSSASTYADVLATRVEDCIVSNCCALLGGAGYRVNFLNCRLFKCRATCGSATERCGMVNTIADDMDSEGSSGIVINDWYQMVNCTVGNQLRKDSGSGCYGLYRQWTLHYAPTNTVCLSSIHSITDAYNCAFTTDLGLTEKGCMVVKAADCALDADYRPDCRKSVLVDKGLASAVPVATDALGGQRVYNGCIDIGAVEGDWRSVFAKDISASTNFLVSAASCGVTEVAATRKVKLVDGETLCAVWTGEEDKNLPCEFKVNLEGEGTLSVTVNGEAFQQISAAGETVVKITGCVGRAEVGFAYSGTGSATIVSSRRMAGTMFLVR